MITGTCENRGSTICTDQPTGGREGGVSGTTPFSSSGLLAKGGPTLPRSQPTFRITWPRKVIPPPFLSPRHPALLVRLTPDSMLTPLNTRRYGVGR
jgi:hypothetical protein